MKFKSNNQRKAVMASLNSRRKNIQIPICVKQKCINSNSNNISPNLTNPVSSLPNEISGFIKLSDRRFGVYYQSMRTNEGIDIHYDSDIKEYRVKNAIRGMSTKMIYAGKNQLDAIIKAKNYMINNSRNTI